MQTPIGYFVAGILEKPLLVRKADEDLKFNQFDRLKKKQY